LAGKNTIEKMYFKDIGDYSVEALKFNERYGERKWETLWNLAEIFAYKPGFLSEDGRIVKASVYRDYLDGILECLQVDLSEAGSDDSKLRLLLFKTRDIKKSYPLDYAEYRERIENFEREIILNISDDTIVSQVAKSGNWIVPDYSGKSPEYVYNSLIIEGGASAVGYMVVATDMDTETNAGVLGVLYKEPGMFIEEAVELRDADEKPLIGEYIILIPEEKLPEGDYVLMRDLVNDFDKYLADYSHLADYAVGRLLRTEGFSYRYEFTYYDNVVPEMEGRIVGQFPAPGSAIIPGETIIRIFMVKKPLWRN
ncbi:MAG: PASTA domain-containing protein, partial [Clostridiales bacterium]|nr:PASTA domain-containing protein [Clostridiales bacterium]